jgi:HK97 family phage prohead protease
MPLIRKAGIQSTEDPLEFVLSTNSPDRQGDIVTQDWDLFAFKKNPIALYQHDSRLPIGTWIDVRVEKNKLMGRLELADIGTSNLIDTVRALVQQKILRAVSIGFRAGTAVPIDDEKPWNGYTLSGNELFEASLVSVPANAEALAVKGLDATPETFVSAYDLLEVGVVAVRAQARRRRNKINRLRARQQQFKRIT